LKFALQTDLALRTLMFLVWHGDRATVAQVAEFYQISRPHVAKVVNQLARLGYVRSIRGVGGGIELSRVAEQISVGEVVMAFEGNLHLLDCVGTEDVCVIQPFCKLRGVLAEAERIQVEYLNGVALSDVVPTRRQVAQVAADK
jgi:Rrf2 family nitric oxide-sensitive transcriptional repressor